MQYRWIEEEIPLSPDREKNVKARFSDNVR